MHNNESGLNNVYHVSVMTLKIVTLSHKDDFIFIILDGYYMVAFI